MDREVLSGFLSGAAVSPAVSMVDKAIFSNASGKASFSRSFNESLLTVVRHPAQFVKNPSLLWVWGVYSSTYIAFNVSTRYTEINRLENASSSVLAFTSCINVSMSVLKDRAFSRMFGTSAPRPIPTSSLVCYGVRDFITIFGSFTLVQPVTEHLRETFSLEEGQAYKISQVFCPLFAQLFNTPIFLYGMDLYNNPVASSMQRLCFIREQFWRTFWLRTARIGPAFSVGGIVNHWLRHKLHNSSKSSE
ncbi:uncharacterized membrane protein C365.16-like [Galendromus occidentalis]|uniref:Uncharacterized membrane protein C365.16-like n=1 Tax=Galendromus occidentalis TaxID=34638 RepID=A0AAJ6VYP2_9ACAR|nr:uncharacterized membrane protein C365.16-like [Galendromus occidentalis]